MLDRSNLVGWNEAPAWRGQPAGQGLVGERQRNRPHQVADDRWAEERDRSNEARRQAGRRVWVHPACSPDADVGEDEEGAGAEQRRGDRSTAYAAKNAAEQR